MSRTTSPTAPVLGLGILLLAIGFAAFQWMSHSPSSLASGQKTLRLAVTDVEGMEALQREFGAFRDRLTLQTGLPMEFFPVSDRTAAVEALAGGQIDLVITGPAEYVIFRSRTAVEPVVGFLRPNYFATVSVRKSSGITRLQQLRGKKVALGDIGSTSKHLGPLKMLIEAGVQPDQFTPVHTSIQAGWEALLSGDVDAFATTSDKIDLVRAKTKDHGTDILARSGQLPMDVLLAAEAVPEEILSKIRKAFTADSASLVKAILEGADNQKYAGMSFSPQVQDSDYDVVREMFVAAGLGHLATVHKREVGKE